MSSPFPRIFACVAAWWRDESRRLTVFVIVSVPALVWSYRLHGGHAHAAHGWTADTLLDPAWIPILLCGTPIVVTAFRKLFAHGDVRAGLLIGIAILAATAVGELFAAGEVAFLMTLGELLEGRTLRKAREGIRKLLQLAPRVACRLREGGEETVDATQLAPGDVVRIRPGETVPADGAVVAGHSSVDQSIVTGEPLPVDKGVGDDVLAGTINRFGSVDVRVAKCAGDSTLQRMIRLIQLAQERKAPVVRLADRWAGILVPTALVTAVVVGLVTGELLRAVTILVVFCPCALVLATPTAVMAAIANLSRHGVLVKSGESLEAMGRLRQIAFDKTGTLTEGQAVVADVVAGLPELSGEALLRLVAGAERRSEHPLGKALARAVPDAPAPSDFRMLPGKGIEATVAGRQLAVGAVAWLEECGVAPDNVTRERAGRLRAEGKAVVGVVMDGRFAGLVALDDRLRADARATVTALRAAGLRRIVLLTGDHAAAAQRMAAAAGVDDVVAGLSPEEKVQQLERHMRAGAGIAMVGDGVNDAPALKAASVGIALGGVGSDIAVEAADIVLMRDDIRRLPHLVRLARRTLATIGVNIAASLLINVGAIVLAATGRLGPALGALVHNAGSIFVVAHAALLLRVKPRA